jgi:hypothetical protein
VDQNAGLSPVSFEVAQSCHTPASFSGRKRFIQDLQVALPAFYTNVGRLLVGWSPKAPPPEEKPAAARIEEVSVIDAGRIADLEASLAAVMNSLSASPPSAPAADGPDGNPSASPDSGKVDPA